MRSLWLQVAAVTAINLKSIGQRRWLSLSTVIAIALVVIVLLAFLAMANGFQRTIAGSGAMTSRSCCGPARRPKSTAR
jgi:putative ABC transport system permease protein